MSDQSRRQFLQGSLALAGLGLLSSCGLLPSPGQQPVLARRIGYFGAGTDTSGSPIGEAFRLGLGELGYVEGRDFVLEYRFAEGKTERLPALAAELVGLPTSVIVATGTPACLAAKQATSSIPIVFTLVADPIAAGLVASLARPGGNVTGVTNIGTRLSAKRFELLKEILPHISRVALLLFAETPNKERELQEAQSASEALGVQVHPVEVRNPEQLEQAFAAIRAGGSEALVISSEAFLDQNRPRIIDLAAQARLPTIGPNSPWPQLGGLISYGPSFSAMGRRTAAYVDKILKGAKPADLPVEQPTTFDLVININTARILGLNVPQSVLQQASELIQ